MFGPRELYNIADREVSSMPVIAAAFDRKGNFNPKT